MLGDYVHESLVLGEAASSQMASVSRRSTLDEDLFSFPNQHETSLCATAGSHQLQKLPTVHEKILQWFLRVVRQRQMKACACTGAVCACVYMTSVLILQFSVWSPLRFFSDVYRAFTGLSVWISSTVVGIATVFTCWTMLVCLTKGQKLRTVFWRRREPWICFLVLLLYNITYCAICMNLTHFPSKPKFLAGLLFISSTFSAISSVFRTDLQNIFFGGAVQLGVVHTIAGMFTYGHESVMVYCFREAFRIVATTACLGSVVGISSSGWYSLALPFNFSFHIYAMFIVCGQLFATKALLKFVRLIVMKPITFPLPPSYAVHTPTPEQTRSITVALDTKEPLLKLFAFYDLRRIAWSDRNRRLEVFSLSQPGGRPRNWANILTACANVLEEIRAQLEAASTRLERYNLSTGSNDLSDGDLMEVDREMLMVPHKSRKQLYSSALRKRHNANTRAINNRLQLVDQSRKAWWNRLVSYPEDQEIFSKFDGNIAVIAIESLYMFVVQSYDEDRYGIVLKDLPGIIATFVELIRTIDKYYRLRANEATQTGGDRRVKEIDAALQSALLRISGKFGEHLNDLNLSHEQLQTIKVVCSSDA